MRILLFLLAVGWCSDVLLHAQETSRIYLSGRDKDQTVPWRFQCTEGMNSGVWTTIPVPSQWELQGFGTLNYKKDRDSAVTEHGLYEKTFQADPDWQGKRVFVVFEGVMTDAAVKLNGTDLGTHQGGYYRFKYEITALLKFGEENLLEVDVAKHSANASVNKAERLADYWVFGGIYRPVYLEVVPSEFIERMAIDAKADGTFSVDAFVRTTGVGDAHALTVEAQVQTLDGQNVGTAFQTAYKPTKSQEPTRLTAQIDSPKTWTAETPHQYQVQLRLKRGDQLLHSVTQRFGFRTIEVRPNDGIYLNDQRIVLKGVNRHSTWPDSGRCLSEEVHRLDIETIKAMNMNAVRMSHYPPDTRFLELCDELGLYVLDELGGWHWAYDTHVGRRLVEEMVTRDVNHPCILFWDNGNEGGNNVSLDEVFGWFDPQNRAVLHPWEAFGWINTAHYLEYDRAQVAAPGAPTRHGPGEEYQEWEDTGDPNRYIYMPTEMMHGLYDGGSGAGLHDYWQLMKQSPVLGGGFIWNLFDEGIQRPDGTIDTEGNAAPDGITGPYREREASFYTIQELWSPIQVQQLENGQLRITNEYSFTNANQCELTWQFRRFAGPGEVALHAVVAEGTKTLPSIAPGDSGEATLDLPSNHASADALAVRINNPSGRELWTWVWPLKPFDQSAQIRLPQTSAAPAIQQSHDSITVKAGDTKFAFSKRTGVLSRVTKGQQAYSFANGPIATVGDSKLTRLTSAVVDGAAVVQAEYTGGLHSVQWTVRADGYLQCDYAYHANGDYEYCGVTFDFPEDKVQSKRWLGEGPRRVWKNRRQGVSLGVWKNDYNNTVPGYQDWDYPAFKGCFSGVRWLRLETTEGPITIVPDDPSKFVQVLTPEQPPEKLRGQTSYSLPECGLALLDAIPPVGSKFKKAATTGPQGQLTRLEGVQRGRVGFLFGE